MSWLTAVKVEYFIPRILISFWLLFALLVLSLFHYHNRSKMERTFRTSKSSYDCSSLKRDLVEGRNPTHQRTSSLSRKQVQNIKRSLVEVHQKQSDHFRDKGFNLIEIEQDAIVISFVREIKSSQDKRAKNKIWPFLKKERSCSLSVKLPSSVYSESYSNTFVELDVHRNSSFPKVKKKPQPLKFFSQ